jgi:hypothetical protein
MPGMDFFKALLAWAVIGFVIMAAVVAVSKGGLLGVAFLLVCLVAYCVAFAVYGCKTH